MTIRRQIVLASVIGGVLGLAVAVGAAPCLRVLIGATGANSALWEPGLS